MPEGIVPQSQSEAERELLGALKLSIELIAALAELMEIVCGQDQPKIAPSRLANYPTNCKPQFRNGGGHAAQH